MDKAPMPATTGRHRGLPLRVLDQTVEDFSVRRSLWPPGVEVVHIRNALEERAQELSVADGEFFPYSLCDFIQGTLK